MQGEARVADLPREAGQAAIAALEGARGPSDLECARELFRLAGDAAGAAEASRRLGEAHLQRAHEAGARGDLGEAISHAYDAALAFEGAHDDARAKAAAKKVLELWPDFEESKSLLIQPLKPSSGETDKSKRLRRLPRAGAPASPERQAAQEVVEAAAAPPVRALPHMYLEMHARSLSLAGKDREARARFEEVLREVEAEVARRRSAQEWHEALSAARALVRLAHAHRDAQRVAGARRQFVALALETSEEALTLDYFAQGHADVPLGALEEARKEALALPEGALAEEIARRAAEAAWRSAELLAALADPRTAAQAILSWEGYWPGLDVQPQTKRALMEHPELAASLDGPLAGLSGLADNHPLRLELAEFDRRRESVARDARARAPLLFAEAAEAWLRLREPHRALEAAARARSTSTERAPLRLRIRILSALLEAQVGCGDLVAASAALELHRAEAARLPDEREAFLRGAAAEAAYAADPRAAEGRDPRLAAARAALAQYLLHRGSGALVAGALQDARDYLDAARHAGAAAAENWLRLISLTSPP